jgi:hypothetical protein
VRFHPSAPTPLSARLPRLPRATPSRYASTSTSAGPSVNSELEKARRSAELSRDRMYAERTKRSRTALLYTTGTVGLASASSRLLRLTVGWCDMRVPIVSRLGSPGPQSCSDRLPVEGWGSASVYARLWSRRVDRGEIRHGDTQPHCRLRGSNVHLRLGPLRDACLLSPCPLVPLSPCPLVLTFFLSAGRPDIGISSIYPAASTGLDIDLHLRVPLLPADTR